MLIGRLFGEAFVGQHAQRQGQRHRRESKSSSNGWTLEVYYSPKTGKVAAPAEATNEP